MSDALALAMIDAGRVLGETIGDTMAAALADPPHLDPEILDGWRLCVIGGAHAALKDAEARLIADGVPPDIAAQHAFSGSIAVMRRFRLAEIAFSATGTAN